MVECPHGHPNPAGWQLCGECGSPLDEAMDLAEQRWYRSKWAILGAAAVATVAVSSVIVSVVHHTDSPASVASPASAENVAVLDWWSQAREPFTGLQQSLADSQRALASVDRSAMQEACQQMHDTSAVELQQHLPAPTAQLTSEVTAAAQDAHAAAHMCMSVLAGTTNSYNGEFSSDLDQANKHLDAAQEIIHRALTAPA